MKNLRYVGGDHIRELSPDDLQKLGVEDAEATLSFKRDASTTVDDKIAEVLLDRVPNLRESTEEELEAEERQLEAELGFAPYNPNDHTVAEIKEVLANASEERRKYILDQEATGQNRKTLFQAVGADYDPDANKQPDEAPAAETDMDPATEEAMEAAGGRPASSSGTDAGGTGGTGNTSGGGTAGPANTSTSAT